MTEYDIGHLDLQPVTTRTWIPPLTVAAYDFYDDELDEEVHVPEHTYPGYWKTETHMEAPINAPPLQTGDSVRFAFTLEDA